MAARTCSTASLQTARYLPVWEGWRRVVLFENRSSPLLPPHPPPVICRNVRPEIGPPPAGEHREESGSVRPAGDEPAAHNAPVLPGRKLPRHRVRRLVSAAWSVLLTALKCSTGNHRLMTRCLDINERFIYATFCELPPGPPNHDSKAVV